jgi:hypothetical protein
MQNLSAVSSSRINTASVISISSRLAGRNRQCAAIFSASVGISIEPARR